MNTIREAGTIEKAIGAGRRMVTATLTVMTINGKIVTTMGIGMGKAATTITEMAIIIATNFIGR